MDLIKGKNPEFERVKSRLSDEEVSVTQDAANVLLSKKRLQCWSGA